MSTHEERMKELEQLDKDVDDILKTMNPQNVNDKLDECNKLLAERLHFTKLTFIKK